MDTNTNRAKALAADTDLDPRLKLTTVDHPHNRLVADRRYRLAAIRAWASDPAGDDEADAYITAQAEALAADHGIDVEVILSDHLAGTLWGFDRRGTCYGCDSDDYYPTCPSCQLDAGVKVGG